MSARRSRRVRADREFAGVEVAALVFQRVAHQLIEGERGGADRIHRQDHGRLFRVEQPGAIGQEGGQVREQVPNFAFGTAAELRRVDEDDVIGLAAADLAGDELCRVVEDPADLGRIEFGGGLVLAAPGDRLLGRIKMSHLGADGGGQQRRGTGVGEEIEHARRAVVHGGDAFQHPLPVRHLLGEEPQMPEALHLAEEFNIGAFRLRCAEPAGRRMMIGAFRLRCAEPAGRA